MKFALGFTALSLAGALIVGIQPEAKAASEQTSNKSDAAYSLPGLSFSSLQVTELPLKSAPNKICIRVQNDYRNAASACVDKTESNTSAAVNYTIKGGDYPMDASVDAIEFTPRLAKGSVCLVTQNRPTNLTLACIKR